MCPKAQCFLNRLLLGQQQKWHISVNGLTVLAVCLDFGFDFLICFARIGNSRSELLVDTSHWNSMNTVTVGMALSLNHECTRAPRWHVPFHIQQQTYSGMFAELYLTAKCAISNCWYGTPLESRVFSSTTLTCTFSYSTAN